ncbi:MAG: adenosylcobinamide-GDP ribazoletransferase [Archaeoglobaceae archaeon]
MTTIPAGGDLESFAKNLWLMPYVGLLLGALISLPLFIDPVLCVIAYVALEGINHIDGLADFGDSCFAPRERKREALKDTRIGAGGVAFVAVYFAILTHSFEHVKVLDIVFAQFAAKFSMLLMLTFAKPAWQGIASELMKHARKRDVLAGIIPVAVALNYAPFLVISALVAFVMVRYGKKNFDGVSGDLAGAANCITFASCLLAASL